MSWLPDLRRFTWLQRLTHLCALLPLAWLLIAAQSGGLGVNPIQRATQRAGDTALVLLLLSLACTPLRRLTGYNPLGKLRRPLGLYAFFYAALHLFIFTGLDYSFDWGEILRTILEKRYTLVGASAFLILAALAVTSIRSVKRRMGKWWKRLHRTVYLAAILVVLHFAWASKGDLFRLRGDIARPLLAAAVLILLFLLRLKFKKRILQT